jgi:hypothetical protein
MTSSSPRRLPVMSGACVAFLSRSWAVDIPVDVDENEVKGGRDGAASSAADRQRIGKTGETEERRMRRKGTAACTRYALTRGQPTRQEGIGSRRRVNASGAGHLLGQASQGKHCGCAAERTRYLARLARHHKFEPPSPEFNHRPRDSRSQ